MYDAQREQANDDLCSLCFPMLETIMPEQTCAVAELTKIKGKHIPHLTIV